MSPLGAAASPGTYTEQSSGDRPFVCSQFGAPRLARSQLSRTPPLAAFRRAGSSRIGKTSGGAGSRPRIILAGLLRVFLIS